MQCKGGGMDKNFERLLATLSIVPANAALSTTEIHRRLSTRGLAVSHRTVQRDLESLAATFGITCDTRSKPYGWRWPKGKARLSRSEEHTSELQSLMRISYAVFSLKKNKPQCT